MKIYQTKLYIGDNPPIEETLFTEKELDAYVVETYLKKMDHVARGAGFKKYTPTTGTKAIKNHLSKARDRAKTYGAMESFAAANCESLKLEITSTVESLLG
jgi:hypothetical protein